MRLIADFLHYQQTVSCHGPPGESPPPLARLLTMLIGALDIAAAACAKAGCWRVVCTVVHHQIRSGLRGVLIAGARSPKRNVCDQISAQVPAHSPY